MTIGNCVTGHKLEVFLIKCHVLDRFLCGVVLYHLSSLFSSFSNTSLTFNMTANSDKFIIISNTCQKQEKITVSCLYVITYR